MSAVVWLKRDLRWRDHAPLAAAAAHEGAIALYVIEPAWLASPTFDPQHLAFALASLGELRAQLAARGLPLLVRVGDAVTVLANCASSTRIASCSAMKKPARAGPTRAIAR
jgi:deoxyribodipyrimidine photo-lyase